MQNKSSQVKSITFSQGSPISHWLVSKGALRRECIVFERTCDAEQRIHEPCACLRVPCSSRLQSIVGCRGFICIIRVQLSYLPAAKKNNSVVKFVSLKQIIRKASFVHHKSFSSWKVDFLNFKKRPNINLYVWTLFWFFEDSKLAYKTTKFKAKLPGRDFGQKHELQFFEKYVM